MTITTTRQQLAEIDDELAELRRVANRELALDGRTSDETEDDWHRLTSIRADLLAELGDVE